LQCMQHYKLLQHGILILRACQYRTDRVPQQYDYKSWALAWPMN
jgi:hypothetical protein